MKKQSILSAIEDQYGAVARSGLSNDSAAVRSVAQAFGYTPEDLASLPPQANMGLSCGNPIALAALREGEVVVDLGCGGGMDVLLAAKRVGATGKAIGIDMTPDMIERAKAGAAAVGATNVEFHLAQIDQLPLADDSVDCVISNCVINLVPDKPQAFREVLRVLKPGGRLVVSDIALKRPLPAEVAQDLQAYVGCIAGAIEIAEYERQLHEAGFDNVVVQDTGADLNAYAQAGSSGCRSSTGCCSTDDSAAQPTSVHDGLAQILDKFDANEFAASVRVHALKPANESAIIAGHHERAATPNATPNAQATTTTTTTTKNTMKTTTTTITKTEMTTNMKTIQVYDKPMCCSTGVCGPDVDPELPRFAADLQWLQSQGHQVERFNLAQQPLAFIQNPEVHRLVAALGTTCLPLIVVDGQIVSQRSYPSREELTHWTGDDSTSSTSASEDQRACCGGGECC